MQFFSWIGRVSIVLLLAVFLLSAYSAANVQEIVTPTGITAWLVEKHAQPVISIKMSFVRSGAAYDSDELVGRAFLAASLLDEGAGDMSGLAFKERLEDNAIELYFTVDDDHFYVHLKTLSPHIDEALHLLRLAITSPRFHPDDVERVKKQIRTIIRKKDESPEYLANKAWSEAAFKGHPYSRGLYGDEQTLARITPDDLREYVEHVFAHENIKIAVVGDIDAESLREKIDHYFNHLPQTCRRTLLLPEATVHADAPMPIAITRPVPQSVAIFGMSGVKRSDPDFYPAYILNYIIGGGVFESRLVQEVREKRGLAYSIYTYLSTQEEAGVLKGYVATEYQRIGKSLELIRQLFTDIHDNGVTESEVARAKAYLIGSFPMKLVRNSDLADFLLGMQLEELGIDFLNKRNDYIRNVSHAQVNRVAERLLNPEQMVTVVVAPASAE